MDWKEEVCQLARHEEGGIEYVKVRWFEDGVKHGFICTASMYDALTVPGSGHGTYPFLEGGSNE